MAGFGASYPCFKPNGAAAGVVVGKLVSANLTVTLASGELWADDGLAEQLSEFASGSIAEETDDMEESVAGIVYGATVNGKKVTYNKGDTPPLGCHGYYQTLMKDGVKYFRGYFYPRVRAALGNSNVQTRNNSITFQTTSTTWTVFADDVGDWRDVERFDTEKDAKEWVAQKCGIPSTKSAKLSAMSLGSLVLSPTFDGDVYAYTAATTNATNTINVTAEDPAATISIEANSSPVNNGDAITWNTGSNTVEITDTNGSETKTYTIDVTKS